MLRRLSSALVVVSLGLAVAVPARAGEPPAEVTELLARYEAAWEARDVFALVALAPAGAPQFLDLLDDERLDHVVQTAVRIRDLQAEPYEDLPGALRVTFVKEHEDVLAAGTVTRGLARIEVLARPGSGGLEIVSHRMVPFGGGADGYRSDDPSTWGEEHGRVERLFYEGHRLLQRGDSAGALERFQRILAGDDPKAAPAGPGYETGDGRFLAQAHYFAAVCEHRRGDRAKAVAHAEQAVALHPDFPLALNFLAERVLDGGSFEDALPYWRRSLSVFPRQPEVAAQLDFHEKALTHYADVDRRVQYLSVRGLPPTKAAAVLARLVRGSDGEPESRRRLAVAYLKSLQPEKAERTLEENAFLYPHDLETQYLLARTYLAMQRFEDALAMLGRVWSRNPTFRDTPVLMAELNAALRRFPDAIGARREALRERPNDPELLYKLGDYSLRVGRRSEALGYLRRAAAEHPPASVRRGIYEALRELSGS